MQEAQLYALWQNLARTGQAVTAGPHRLRVLDAGRLNLQRGPDFVSALFELDDVRISGDVEMHLRLQDWYAHHHHLDPFFKNVCLHVVLQPAPSSRATVAAPLSGRAIPTIRLAPEDFPSALQSARVLCRPPAVLNKEAVQSLALERLHLKIRYFQHFLESETFEQAFYEHLLRSLGYPSNSWPFQLLARRLPWRWLERSCSAMGRGFDPFYALYAGMAGFLPAASSDPYLQKLIFLHGELRHLLPAAGLGREHWQFAGQRPCNHPHFRLAAWVSLLVQHPGLPIRPLSRLLKARLPLDQLWGELQRLFKLRPQGYWKKHHMLASNALARSNQNFLGKARVTELIINLIIPLFAARALLNGSHGFFEYLQSFYLWLPLNNVYRTFSRRFPWLALYRRRFPCQALMQAFIQLNNQYCQLNRCALCPLAHTLDK
ncbi:DUF2851 family protein [Caldithrix abyssi]